MKTGQRYQRVQHTDDDVGRHGTSTGQEHLDKGAEDEVDLGFATPPQRSSPQRVASGDGSHGSLPNLKRNPAGSPRLQLRASRSPQEGRRVEFGSEGGTGDIPQQDEDEVREVSIDFVDEAESDDASAPLWSPSLQSNSFDLLDEDDEDEINLQRYHLDSPYLSNITSNSSHGGDLSMIRSSNSGDTNLSSPHLTLDGRPASAQHVSRERVDSWIALVNDPSNKGGSYSASSNTSTSRRPVLDAVWTYVQIIRRQARQRRAQRLLTMNSEGLGERMQYYFLTYCWDATDVGLLLVLVLLGIWMLGLVLYLGGPPKATTTTNTAEDGEEELSEGFWKHHLTNWWWALGVILFIRMVGPCLIKQHIARRRRRRHGSDQQMERYSDGAGVEFTMSKTQHDELQREQDLQNQAPATTTGATLPMSPIPVETEYDVEASTTISDSPQLEIT